MALPHAQPLDVIDVRPLQAGLRAAKTHSLIKTAKLQLIQMVLPAGQGLPEHRLPGEITVQCIEGEVEVITPARPCRLRGGEVVVLPGGEPHAVQATRDATLLVTVLLGP
jgi:quercetin dioxygenase-like cupin family protein